MAKSTIRKSNQENNMAPAKRGRATSGETVQAAAPKAAPRTRRKAAAAVETVSATEFAAGAAEVEAADISAASSSLTHDQIALRAYHLFLERGGVPGDQFRDWVTAERQLREGFSQAHN